MLEYVSEKWAYRTLPNKMYELVKNTGDMHKMGTGYYTDAESEMLTILEYLNHGVKTNITEAMIEQIEKAISDAENVTLESDPVDIDDEIDFIEGEFSIKYLSGSFVAIADMEPYVISRVDGEYNIYRETSSGKKDSKQFPSLKECRQFAVDNGCKEKYVRSSLDPKELIELWI